MPARHCPFSDTMAMAGNSICKLDHEVIAKPLNKTGDVRSSYPASKAHGALNPVPGLGKAAFLNKPLVNHVMDMDRSISIHWSRQGADMNDVCSRQPAEFCAGMRGHMGHPDASLQLDSNGNISLTKVLE